MEHMSLRRLAFLLGVLVGTVHGLPTGIRRPPNPDATAISFIENRVEVIRDHPGAIQHGQNVDSLIGTNKGTKVIEQRGRGSCGSYDTIPTGSVLDTPASNSRLPEPDASKNHIIINLGIPAVDGTDNFPSSNSIPTGCVIEAPASNSRLPEPDASQNHVIINPGIPAVDDPNNFLGSDPMLTGSAIDASASHGRIEPHRTDRNYMLAPATNDLSTFIGPEPEPTLEQKQQLQQKRQLNEENEEDKRLSKRWVSPEGNPIFDTSTIITLINATPYRWRKGYSHSYQLEKWEDRFPEYIEPGKSERVFSDAQGGIFAWDSAGEVAYHLEGTSKPMSFMIERRRGKRHPIFVQFLEELETNVTRKHTQMDLGFHEFPGGSAFMLAGKEGDFISTAPPGRWMQALLPDIGHMSLREIVLPRTHHSGMSQSKELIGIAPKASTLTQTKDVKYQLEELGVRVLDVRPLLFRKVFRVGHGATVLGRWNGRLGETLEDVARAVGEFHKSHPGEMVIIDIPASETGHIGVGISPLGDDEIQTIFETMVKFTKPFQLPDLEDITQWPLSRFIGNNTSGTIIRVSPSWAEKRNYPGGANGFVSDRTFPMNHRWSNKEDGDELFSDQIEYLRRNRASRKSKIYHSDWVITLSNAEAIFPTQSITDRALQTYGGLYDNLWNVTNESLYPNWIAMDNVHSTELTTFVMILNKCFVARNCGKMGGKVTISSKEKTKAKNTKVNINKGGNTKVKGKRD